ncbi:unnamed protein product [Adineta steineri]|uniref:Uncharacterized protein n=2 Tax=Adineta steineri TaxID=433720 RepID=A0A818M6A2_9BILA|nr:unnamed protein product [Adineta steineri]CAF3585158.1 unnamed protein product [Adineta steineri]
MGHKSSKYRQHRSSIPVQSRSMQAPGLAATKSDTSIAVRKLDLSNFAVIAVIFNPVKYKSRYNHYQQFANHMAQSGVELYTIECIFESAERFGLPKQQFEVTRSTDRRHIRVSAPSIIWMKENLINVAIKSLPQNIEYIAWIDADIEFKNLDWPYRTIAELQRYPIVQLFELAYFLGPGGKSDVLRNDYSFGYSIRHNKPIDPKRYDDWYAHPGYAWAIRRSTLNSIGGFLDFCIIGSGDLHFAFALLNRMEETLRPGLHPDYRQLAMVWAKRVADVAQNGANVGYVPVNIYHHWHGERNDRHYADRWAILENHQFSPINDLEKNNATGVIRLADKTGSRDAKMIARMEALERDIVAYFQSRNEDSKTRSIPPQHPPPAQKKPLIKTTTHTQRNTGSRYPTNPSRSGTGGTYPHMWTSGPAGTHVDDHNSYSHLCTCPGHHHQAENCDCPCSPNHMDDQHCWNPSEHDDHHYHHHHNDDDHHHHHDQHPDNCQPPDDHHGGHHSSHGHDHHGGWDNQHSSHEHHGGSDNHHSSGGGWDNHYSTDGGGDYHHSSGGGGFDSTDYNGPGSFY